MVPINAGIIHQNIEAATLVADRCIHFGHLVGLVDIGGHRQDKVRVDARLVPPGFDGLLVCLGVIARKVCNDDCSMPGKRRRRCRTKPTDVAFGPQREIYVSDGYGNNRIVKFTPKGEFLTQWGEAGDGRGQFNLPHTIVVDRNGRVVVGDRENDRVQVFESSGKLVAVWPGFAPFGLAYDKQGHLFVADGRANKVLQLDDHGKVVRSWGQEGTKPGQFQLPHMLAADARGNLYVGEIKGKRFQKLIRQ